MCGTLRRDLAELPTSGDDPLEELIGLVSSSDGPTDLALNHDHYLYGTPKRPA